MSEPSVSKLAIVVVIELLSGSSSTLPQVPVTGSTRFGVFPAAMCRLSGFPEMVAPFHVKIDDLSNHLVLIAAGQYRGAKPLRCFGRRYG